MDYLRVGKLGSARLRAPKELQSGKEQRFLSQLNPEQVIERAYVISFDSVRMFYNL